MIEHSERLAICGQVKKVRRVRLHHAGALIAGLLAAVHASEHFLLWLEPVNAIKTGFELVVKEFRP